MKVLVACEESQAVCIEFRKRGHEAYSCDLQSCSGGHPEWHLQDDVFTAINYSSITDFWDMIIAFPPCQKLSKAGGAHWKKPEFKKEQNKAIEFVLKIYHSRCPYIAIENPIGRLNTVWRKPDQVIHPWQFGHPFTKETCLWLKNLTPLQSTKIVEPKANWVKPGNIRNRKFSNVMEGAGGDQKIRSKTFAGIAKAMAEQWG